MRPLLFFVKNNMGLLRLTCVYYEQYFFTQNNMRLLRTSFAAERAIAGRAVERTSSPTPPPLSVPRTSPPSIYLSRLSLAPGPQASGPMPPGGRWPRPRRCSPCSPRLDCLTTIQSRLDCLDIRQSETPSVLAGDGKYRTGSTILSDAPLAFGAGESKAPINMRALQFLTRTTWVY